MKDFARRVLVRQAIIEDPTLWFWSPAFYEILNRLKRTRAPGSLILEVGCGLGFFLHALRNEGFTPIGLDVAETVVELNRRDGFKVWHGTVESVSPGWVTPDAVVCMFMLQHLESPLETLRSVRRLWPNAPLAIAQYGPSNIDDERSKPPRTLTRWNSKSLESALTRAGYRAEVKEIPSTGSESRLVRPMMIARQRLDLTAKGYRLTKRAERFLFPRLTKPLRRQGFVLLAFAEPSVEDASPQRLDSESDQSTSEE